jgi:hypothetical protein
MLEVVPAAARLAGILNPCRLKPVTLADCSYLQMQGGMFRVTAILNQILLRLVGRPNLYHDRVCVAFAKVRA